MNYIFSDRVNELKPSAIREIFKYAVDPSVISLSAGNPAPEAFPSEAISKISANIFESRPIDALQYSFTEGYTPLRNQLREYMRDNHRVGKEFDDILITSGAQQIMDLATKSLCNEGDTIICESPSFIGSLNTFRSYRCNLVGVELEEDGINIEKLEEALKENKKVKLIYTIPNFQNPSGVTTSLEKRRAMYELAKKYNVLIIEDNPYGDLRYEGKDIENIKAMDTEGIVIYAGSFSKIISPGMRVGYCIGAKEILQKMIVCKQGQDVHTNIWAQMICDEFMKNYDFKLHLENLKKLYSKKAKLTTSLIEKHLSPEVTYNKITGGLFTYCRLPQQVDMLEFCKQAVIKKVCVVPGNAFLTDEKEKSSNFRINFSTPTDEQLEKGITILGQVAKNMIK